jgi:hypothetical protein
VAARPNVRTTPRRDHIDAEQSRGYRSLTLTPARMQFGVIPLAAMLLGDEAAIPLTSSSIEWRIGRPTERRMTSDN